MVSEDAAGHARGVVTQVSALAFEDTVSRLVGAIEHAGLRVFDVIDHQAAALDASLALRPTRVVVFGSPAAGTPLMVDHPLLALELPLRILVWEGDDHHVRVSFLEPEGLAEQFGVAADRAGPLGGPARVIELASLG